jgi:AcrR family transcriptional regulator
MHVKSGEVGRPGGGKAGRPGGGEVGRPAGGEAGGPGGDEVGRPGGDELGRPGGGGASRADPPGASSPEPERPRTKAEQRELTTSSLINAARELFAERGYAGVGTEEIVQRAGVTRGALYHHFKGGKEDLFRAVLVQVSAETTREVVEAASRAGDAWEELLLGADAFLDASLKPEVQRIMLVDGPAVLGWDVWRAADGDYALGMLEAAIRNAIDAGHMIEQPPRALAHVLIGALDEAAMVVARADDPAEARQEMGQTVRRLLEGLRGPTA